MKANPIHNGKNTTKMFPSLFCFSWSNNQWIIYLYEYIKMKVHNSQYVKHYVKSVRIRRFFGLYFSSFGVNRERYGVSLSIQSECGKIRTKKTHMSNQKANHSENIAFMIKSQTFFKKKLNAEKLGGTDFQCST